jgi:hypothetical protein
VIKNIFLEYIYGLFDKYNYWLLSSKAGFWLCVIGILYNILVEYLPRLFSYLGDPGTGAVDMGRFSFYVVAENRDILPMYASHDINILINTTILLSPFILMVFIGALVRMKNPIHSLIVTAIFFIAGGVLPFLLAIYAGAVFVGFIIYLFLSGVFTGVQKGKDSNGRTVYTTTKERVAKRGWISEWLK